MSKQVSDQLLLVPVREHLSPFRLVVALAEVAADKVRQTALEVRESLESMLVVLVVDRDKREAGGRRHAQRGSGGARTEH